MSEKKYVHITVKPFNEVDGKTVYGVHSNKGDSLLGLIEFYPRWKTYTFAPEEDSVFDATCLSYIIDFMVNHAGKQ